MAKSYAFISISDRETRRNVGVCIVEFEDWENLNFEGLVIVKGEELGIIPKIKIPDYAIFQLNEEQFQEQDLDLNTFYSRAEIEAKNFKKFQKRV